MEGGFLLLHRLAFSLRLSVLFCILFTMLGIKPWVLCLSLDLGYQVLEANVLACPNCLTRHKILDMLLKHYIEFYCTLGTTIVWLSWNVIS